MPAARPATAPPAQKKNLEPGRANVERETVNAELETGQRQEMATAVAEVASSTQDSGPSTQYSEPTTQHSQLSTQHSSDDDDDLPAVGKVWSAPTESLSSLMAKHRAAAATAVVEPPAPAAAPAASDAANVEAVDPANLPAVWQTMLGLLSSHGTMLHSLISQGRLIGIVEGRVVLRFGHQHETFIRMWEKNGKRELICDAASKVLNQNVGVKFEIDDAAAPVAPVESRAASEPMVKRNPPPRPAPQAAPEVQQIPEVPTIKVTNELVESLVNANPLIKSVVQRLGGQVVKVE
jgi:hypothetical protein